MTPEEYESWKAFSGQLLNDWCKLCAVGESLQVPGFDKFSSDREQGRSLALALDHMTHGEYLWFRLAVAMGRQYAPEFKESSRGRPKKWPRLFQLLLTRQVAHLMHFDGLTKRQACAELGQREPWLSRIDALTDGRGKPVADAGVTLERKCWRLKEELKEAGNLDRTANQVRIDRLSGLLGVPT